MGHYNVTLSRPYDGEVCLSEQLATVCIFRDGRLLVRLTDDGAYTAVYEAMLVVRRMRKAGRL